VGDMHGAYVQGMCKGWRDARLATLSALQPVHVTMAGNSMRVMVNSPEGTGRGLIPANCEALSGRNRGSDRSHLGCNAVAAWSGADTLTHRHISRHHMWGWLMVLFVGNITQAVLPVCG